VEINAMQFSTLKLRTRLMAGFAAVCVIGAAVSAVGIRNMAAMHEEAERVYAMDMIGLSHVKEANINLLYVGRSLRNAILAPQSEDRVKFLEAADKELQEVRALLDKSQPLFALKDEKAAFGEVDDAWVAYLTECKALRAEIHAAAPGDSAALTVRLFGVFRQAVDRLDDSMTKMAQVKEGNARLSAKRGAAAYARTRALMLALASGAVISGLAIGFLLASGVTRKLGAEPDEAMALARQVAQGDLSVPIALREGDRGSLMASLRDMRDSLAVVVANVRSNAEGVATASAQIAQGNGDLSSRTEEQASALEQTAASMEELGSTVAQNADNARQANQLAQGASAVAGKGREVVDRVEQTMRRIDESSKKIADIIGVIDGIAFQTNILALNAAVEAARAGEQGRGFAVVAAEVRTLAQRSAEAAKEIKSLIATSVERVEQGSALVGEAGTTMGEVVDAIRRVTDIMGEISAASVQQSSGVAQIGDAVNQMDKATQQNAALVEESAAAADNLNQQARKLVGAVAVFRLAEAPAA
jgi:methyl-accepting chemotaxis protein